MSLLEKLGEFVLSTPKLKIMLIEGYEVMPSVTMLTSEFDDLNWGKAEDYLEQLVLD